MKHASGCAGKSCCTVAEGSEQPSGNENATDSSPLRSSKDMLQHAVTSLHILFTVVNDSVIAKDKCLEKKGMSTCVNILQHYTHCCDYHQHGTLQNQLVLYTLQLCSSLSEHEPARMYVLQHDLATPLATACFTQLSNTASTLHAPTSSAIFTEIQLAALNVLCNLAFEKKFKTMLRTYTFPSHASSTATAKPIAQSLYSMILAFFSFSSPLFPSALSLLINLLTDATLRQQFVDESSHIVYITNVLNGCAQKWQQTYPELFGTGKSGNSAAKSTVSMPARLLLQEQTEKILAIVYNCTIQGK